MCFLRYTTLSPKKATDYYFFFPLTEVVQVNSMFLTHVPQASSKVTKKRA